MREIFCDSEFSPVNGDLPHPICFVAVTSNGAATKRWVWKGSPAEPIHWDEDDVMVCYSAVAELTTLRQLKWPFPKQVIDLYVEFRNQANGVVPEDQTDLLSALNYCNQPGRSSSHKEAMTKICADGVDAEVCANRPHILDYCTEDAHCLIGLYNTLLPGMNIAQALARGEYMIVVAEMEAAGIPVDARRYQLISDRRDHIRRHISYVADQWHPVFDIDVGGFSARKFERWLRRRGLEGCWPRLPTGRLSLDQETFDDMSALHPDLRQISEIRSTITRLRNVNLIVGADGRARTSLGAFRTVTGRNQPRRGSEYIFAYPRWMRSLVQPEPRMGLAYLDWCQQEFGIVAALSGDRNMQEAYNATDGDPYMAFARTVGKVPNTATKESHPVERELYKRCVLAVQYCMGARLLARRIGCTEADARALLQDHHDAFPDYWRWLDRISISSAFHREVNAVFGWRMLIAASTNPCTTRNFGGQANGAEMMRLACVLGQEAGIKILTPVHDALLIEAPLVDLDDAIRTMQSRMMQASREVLSGFELRSDAYPIRSPERFKDPKGGWDIWTMVMDLLEVDP